MAVRFFGQWLLQKGCVTSEQLLKAIDDQKKTNLSLGEIAVKEGLLTVDQALQINVIQQRTDAYFGEIAQEQEMLSQQQVEHLLQKQKAFRKYLGEILVDNGAITQESLNRELQAYQEEQEKIDKINDVVLSGLEQAFVKDGIYAISTTFGRTAHMQLKMAGIEVGRYTLQDLSFIQYLNQKPLSFLMISIANRQLFHVAEKLLGDEYDEISELTLDVGKEFLNIIMGTCAVRLSTHGVLSKPSPPEVFNSIDSVPVTPNLVSCRFDSELGDIIAVFGF